MPWFDVCPGRRSGLLRGPHLHGHRRPGRLRRRRRRQAHVTRRPLRRRQCWTLAPGLCVLPLNWRIQVRRDRHRLRIRQDRRDKESEYM